ncbi:caspase family protein [Streptomyces griseosporeus]|uniref:caspase, EACC1-associated type n=1 Tax=Streptomyces griseosporeus TaxID=1910 RepID=UPI0036FE8D44
MKGVPDPAASRAVFIGTSYYTGSLPDLPAVASNLVALAELLCSADLLGLPEQNCVVVADPETPAQMIDPIVEAAVEATDTLLVYYAGHGLLARQPTELHLALRGSDQQRASYTAVPYGVIGEEMARTRAERHVVVLDCCYSGRALGRMGSDDPATALADEAAIAGTYVIAAAGETKTALAVPGERHTAFTAELLATLQHGIPGEGPYLSLDSIFQEVAASLRAKQRPLPQRRIRNTAGQLILARNRAFAEHAEAHGPADPSPPPPHDLEPTHLRTLAKNALVHRVVFTPDSAHLAVACGKTAQVLRLAGQETVSLRDGNRLFASHVRDVAVASDGHRLATAHDQRTVIWAIRQEEPRPDRIGSTGAGHVAFSPDGRLLATAGSDGAHIWDTASGTRLRTFPHSHYVKGVAFSPDGSLLATGDLAGTAHIWNVASGAEVLTVTHSDRVHAVAFSPDGSLFATGGRDRSARVWTTATGENMLTVVHHWDPDLPHAHSAYRDPRRPLPDKPVYATYGDLNGGLVYEFAPDTAPSNNGRVAAVAFSPDGRLLATGSEDNTARLWDLTTGAQLHQVLHRGAPNGVVSVAFSPDGRLFATASHDQTIQLWRLKADRST